MQNYDRKSSYHLTVKPSPNIPNSDAVLLYPGLRLFEGSIISVGRGTDFPFQVIGHRDYSVRSFSFVPKPSSLSSEPKYFNQTCYGLDLRKSEYLISHPKKINIWWLIEMHKNLDRTDFFDDNFNYHAGNAELKEQIKNRMKEQDIRQSWEADLEKFKNIRKKYLLYPDFK